MLAEGRGVIIYLEQEGRGAGLIAKAKGYHVSQKYGVDTFAAYRCLGLPVDPRTYEMAVSALRALRLRSVRLLTNNPDKSRALAEAGILVTQVPLLIEPPTPAARTYLMAKRREHGHDLPHLDAETTAAQADQPTRGLRWADLVTPLTFMLASGVAALVLNAWFDI
ncbi:hypothetical protein GCM10027167_49540 [Nocardia heshunensis]